VELYLHVPNKTPWCGDQLKEKHRVRTPTTGSRPALGPTQPPIEWVLGAVSLGVKRQGREADHSPPSSAEVKNVFSYLHSPIRLHGVVFS
jgi:hypothetical protein